MSIYLYVFSLICPLIISSVNLPIHLFPPCMVMNLVVNQSSTSLGLFGTVVLAKTLERDVILCAVMHLCSLLLIKCLFNYGFIKFLTTKKAPKVTETLCTLIIALLVWRTLWRVNLCVNPNKYCCIYQIFFSVICELNLC